MFSYSSHTKFLSLSSLWAHVQLPQTSSLISWSNFFFFLKLWLDQGLTGCHVKWTLAPPHRTKKQRFQFPACVYSASSLSFARKSVSESIRAAKSREFRGREYERRESLSFRSHSRPCSLRDFAAEILSLTDFRAKECSQSSLYFIDSTVQGLPRKAFLTDK